MKKTYQTPHISIVAFMYRQPVLIGGSGGGVELNDGGKSGGGRSADSREFGFSLDFEE